MSFKNITKFLTLCLVLLGGIATQNSYGAKEQIVRYNGPDTDHYPEDKSLVPFTDTKTKLIGYKDKKGHTVISAQFKNPNNCIWEGNRFSKFGITQVSYGRSSDDFFILHKSGKILAKSFFFDNGPDYFVQGLSRFEENGKIGFIDKTGKIAVPAKFDSVNVFNWSAPITTVCEGCKEVPADGEAGKHGMTSIKGGKWGLINRQGKVVIPMEYDESTILGVDDQFKLILIKGGKHYLVIKTGNKYKVKEVQVEKGEYGLKLKG